MNISEIARKAKVSTATVSRVMNNSGYVKAETRERVMRVINEQGYTPSAVAQSLSKQKTNNIGYITPDIPNPFSADVLDGVTQVAEMNNYNVFVFNSNESPEKEHQILNIVQQQRLDGIIISPIRSRDDETKRLLETMDQNGTPVVQFDRKLEDASLSAILSDNEKGAQMAIEQLLKEGHRKIGIVEGDTLNWAVKERVFGYCKALLAADIPIRSEYMVPSDQRIKKAYEAAKRMMELPDPPTAIFTCSNFMTLGVLKYFTEKNLVIGRDVALIGYDDNATLNAVGYKVSVIDQSGTEMGKIAMELLIRKLESEEHFCERRRLPVKMILRGSEKISENVGSLTRADRIG